MGGKKPCVTILFVLDVGRHVYGVKVSELKSFNQNPALYCFDFLKNFSGKLKVVNIFSVVDTETGR